MKHLIFIFVLLPLAFPGSLHASAPSLAIQEEPPGEHVNPGHPDERATNKKTENDQETETKPPLQKATAEKTKSVKVEITPLTDEQQEKLLAIRLDGSMGGSFKQFSNMFLVKSKINLGVGIGLMTGSREISNLPLQPTFPDSYEPTLREFLDAIALQTSSEWKYDPTNQFLKSDVEMVEALGGLAMFEFKTRQQKKDKPFEISLADGWKAIDRGSWVMNVPPDFPVGMDIYEMGSYSTKENDKTKFHQKIRTDVATTWAQRVNPQATADDFESAQVGEYDALYYELMIPSQLGKDIKWRQWVFMVDDECYFVVSTILPELEDKIFPDVKKMLTTFKMKSSTK